MANARCLRQILSRYNEVVDLLQVGAYQPGVSVETDAAVQLYPEVCRFLQQELGTCSTLDQTNAWMQKITEQWSAAIAQKA